MSYPSFMWFLLLLIPMIAIMFVRYYRGRRYLESFAGSWRSSSFFDLYTVKCFFISFGIIIFVVFVILSLVGFPGDGQPASYEPNGVDVVFAVDVSRSMNATDIKPSRLGASENIIRAVCDNVDGGRFGIVVFKGQGVKIIPATEDTESVYTFLDFLDTNLLSSPGSNIESGIEAALSAFPKGEERDKYIILISDGEALSGDVQSAVEKAKEAEVSILTIGTGTADGSFILDSDNNPVLESSGRKVITKLNEDKLRSLSSETDGAYYLATDNLLLPELLKKINNVSGAGGKKYRLIPEEEYRLFLLIALFGLLLSRIVKVLKWKKNF
ncbi:MAG: VWA domain-containing protein [Spirochaetales bacterium]|nr:VWA domain-containing protein [Spirochaetales bacterium]